METLKEVIETLQLELDKILDHANKTETLERSRYFIEKKIEILQKLSDFNFEYMDFVSEIQRESNDNLKHLEKAIKMLQFFGVGIEGFKYISTNALKFCEINKDRMKELSYQDLLLVESEIRKLTNFKRLLNLPLAIPKNLSDFIIEIEVIDENKEKILNLVKK